MLFSRLCHKHHSTEVKGKGRVGVGGGGSAPVGAIMFCPIYHYPVVTRTQPWILGD